jgi:membrane-associated phospholipid phosphatase
MRQALYVAVFTTAVVHVPAVAQDRSLKYDLERVFQDAWFTVTAPTHATAGEWQTVGIVAGGVGLLVLADEPAYDWLQHHPGSLLHRAADIVGEKSVLNYYGRTTQFLLPFSLVLYGAGWAVDSNDLKDAGIGCITSNVTTTVARSLLTVVPGRERPLNGHGAFSFELLGGVGEWPRRSFPGGHAANAFACTSYWTHRFDLGIAEPALYALATAVSVARVVDDVHWTSDSFAGMSFGYAVGKGVAGRFRQREGERAERSMQPGLYVGGRITF